MSERTRRIEAATDSRGARRPASEPAALTPRASRPRRDEAAGDGRVRCGVHVFSRR